MRVVYIRNKEDDEMKSSASNFGASGTILSELISDMIYNATLLADATFEKHND